MLLFKIGQYEAATIMGDDEQKLGETAAILLGYKERKSLEYVPRVQIGIATEGMNIKFFRWYVADKRGWRVWSYSHSPLPLEAHERALMLKRSTPEDPTKLNRFVGDKIGLLDTVVKPDAFGWDDKGVYYNLDAKHTSRTMDEAVEHYYPHMQFTMLLMGTDFSVLSCFMGLESYKFAEIRKDLPYQAEMKKRIIRYRERVLAGDFDFRGTVAHKPTKAALDLSRGRIEMTADGNLKANEWGDAAARFIANSAAAEALETAKADLKLLVPDGYTEAYGAGVTVKVAKNGAKSIKLTKEATDE